MIITVAKSDFPVIIIVAKEEMQEENWI